MIDEGERGARAMQAITASFSDWMIEGGERRGRGNVQLQREVKAAPRLLASEAAGLLLFRCGWFCFVFYGRYRRDVQ